jgi:hypothetical protein
LYPDIYEFFGGKYEELVPDTFKAVAVITDRAPFGDYQYYEWHSHVRYIITPVCSPNSLARHLEKGGFGGIRCLIISGDGSPGAGIQASVKDINEEMDIKEAKRITARMASDGYVVLAGCQTGEDRDDLQDMANLLQRRVYGTTDESFGLYTWGEWVYADPAGKPAPKVPRKGSKK